MTSVMWFRRDLRIEDNTALKHALNNSDSVVLFFHINEDQILENDSKNQKAFFNSVNTFKNNLKNKGAKLYLYYGDLKNTFENLKYDFPNWNSIYFNLDDSGFGLERDLYASKILEEMKININLFHDHYLHSANEIKTDQNTNYKVYSAYFKKWEQLSKPKVVDVNFNLKKIVSKDIVSDKESRLLKLINDNTSNYNDKTGSEIANEKLDYFINNHLENYDKNRDFPNLNKTSQLSSHLRTGEISIRTVYDSVIRAKDSAGKETFIRELAWRDFYNMTYAFNPDQKEMAIRPEFDYVEWDNNQKYFQLWKEGKTGYPIVDAAMRQLNQTGWMHNRLRMIAASFLVKDLLIDWRLGEAYFQKQLIDYDKASNIGGWQWVASTGTDSAPYFRIFNPTTQSQRFDPDGLFIKKYIPELKNINNKKIHEPSLLTEAEEEKFKVKIGIDYPKPIISHKIQRLKVLEAYKKSKNFYKQYKNKLELE